MNQELIDAAKVVLADTYLFAIKAQNYHWNVVGSNFPQYHELFGSIYEEAVGSIDTIAEEIRTMGSFVPGSMGRFMELGNIQDEREQIDARTMLERLLNDNATIMETIMKAYAEAEQAKDYAFSDLMAERLAAHKKHGWMLKSTLAG